MNTNVLPKETIKHDCQGECSGDESVSQYQVNISVVIPTYDRYEVLYDTCQYLSSQEDCLFEVLVIDQTPVERRKAFHVDGIRYFIQQAPSASAARNLGLRQAHGEVVLFIDDDVIIEDEYFLFKHWRHYADPDIVGVAGAAPDVGQSCSLDTHRFFRASGLGWIYFSPNYRCQTRLRAARSNNLSVRRRLALDIGGMDEQFERGAHREEADFGLRLTEKYSPFLYDPSASLVHIGNATGGIRAWQQGETVKAKHHMIGELYMMFRHIPWKYRLEYMAISLLYFICPRKLKTSPKHFLLAIQRYFSAVREAKKKYAEGPKLICKVDL